jgi:MraZ protein
LALTGEFRHNIDAKGRLIVPSRLREELGDRVVLTTWFENCIAMWSEERFESRVAQRLLSERNSNPRLRSSARRIASSAHTDGIDGQGRISVPAGLREGAGIEREVVVVGALDHAEIWDPAKWAEELGRTAAGGFEELAKELDF